MASDPLRRARLDFQNGKYARVISYLEPLSLTYRDSHLFYYLLGSSCLFTGDIGGASTYLRRAEQLNFRHSETQAALAAVHVRRGDTDKAVQLYLDILEREPENRFALKALAFLRSNASPERLAQLTNSGAISYLYPKPPTTLRFIARTMLIIATLAIAVLALMFVVPSGLRAYRNAKPVRNGLESFLLSEEERKNPVSAAGNFEYILTEKEAVSAFQRAKDLFATWNDEAALVEINRLLLSNAAASIKTKAETLKGFAQNPDFTNVKERYDYSQVLRDPRLFDGVAIVWKGSAANVRDENTHPVFDFLVGYQDKKKLEGIVSVDFDFPLKVASGMPFELLGRVRVSGKSFKIEGLAIHALPVE